MNIITAPVITVSELNGYIKKMFDAEMMLKSLLISGEISNFSPHYRTGHLYFSLKDENASVKAVMFARQASRLRFTPENGMKVLLIGRVGVFERDGVYQIYVDDMQPDGAGALAVAFEQLKKKLEAEGLFSPAHKKSLPPYPKKIGVITSPTGAAVQDIFNITERRWNPADIVFAPVTVQGPRAAFEMINAIERFNKLKAADVIILGRGGGSAEDLWCFNDEMLARAVFNSEIPIVSAVGHETDFTIVDFVADRRAPTPSAAAELVTPDKDEEILYTGDLYERLVNQMEEDIRSRRKQLDLLLARRSFTEPGHFFDREKKQIENERLRLFSAAEHICHKNRNRLTAYTTALSSLNPLSVLLRGYSITSVEEKIVTGVADVNVGDLITSRLSDGTVISRVSQIYEKESK